jgi:hypothetical protein
LKNSRRNDDDENVSSYALLEYVLMSDVSFYYWNAHDGEAHGIFPFQSVEMIKREFGNM